MSEEKILRKIKSSEIKQVAEVLAECFEDYPLYSVFFKKGEKFLKSIFYFFWMRTFARRDYTYVTDDLALVISVKKPGDEEHSFLPLFFNPAFLFGIVKTVPLSVLKLVNEYSALEKSFQDKYYNKETDNYIQMVCVTKKKRGSSLFFNALRELDDGKPVFAETHTDRNAALYTLLGAKTVDTGYWHGIPHYIIKRS